MNKLTGRPGQLSNQQLDRTKALEAGDREIAYEQNVTGLEKAWTQRIEARAAAAYRGSKEVDSEHRRDDAIDAVEKMLFDSLHWENVKATDISDIAYEAVDRVIASGV
jgi:hypothetical protein